MADFVTFRLFDSNGDPLTGAAPSFDLYANRAGVAQSQPDIAELQAGLYVFLPADGDVEAGVAWVVDGGASAVPRRASGTICNTETPFHGFLYEQGDGSLWAGAAPTVDTYVDGHGDTRTPPALVPAATFFYTLTPTEEDVAAGVSYVIAAPSGAVPSTGYSGDFDVESGATATMVTFGITPNGVRRHHFPYWNDFSTDSSPTLAVVADMLVECAAELAGKLAGESISPASIEADTVAYYSCRGQLRRMVAVRVLRASTGDKPLGSDTWKDEVAAWFEGLADGGGTFLGDPDLEAGDSSPDGPHSHISEYRLDIGDPLTEASSAVPMLRKDDQL